MAFLTKSLSQFISSGIPPYKRDPVPSPYILSTSPPDSSMELYVLEHRLQVCSIPKTAISHFCHSLIKISLLSGARPKFFSITQTKDCYTIIVTNTDFQELPKLASLKVSGQLWRVLTVSVGAMGTNNELGGVSKIAKSVIGPLADHAISVLCMSTYQSDFILVKECQLDDAIRCLGSMFKIFNEDHKRLNDSQILSSSPTSPSITKKIRPIVHPLHSPDSLYHITGLDASKLQSVLQILLELLFYSGELRDHSEALDFFHFSIVTGDISLVLDTETMKKFPNNVLYTRKNDDVWRMVVLGGEPLGFEECGIVAQVVEPLASSQMSTYYISSYDLEYFMVLEKDLDRVMDCLCKLKIENILNPRHASTDCIIADNEDTNITEQLMDIIENINGDYHGGHHHNTPVTNSNSCDNKPCQTMSLGEALQKENVCPSFQGVVSSSVCVGVKTFVSDESSCGTSPMSDWDGHFSSSNSGNAKCGGLLVTEPIPIPP